MNITPASADRSERYARVASLGYDYAGIPKVAVERCNLCEAGSFNILCESDRYGFPAVSCVCCTCGLVFLNPMMTADAYGEFYKGTYRPLLSAYYNKPYTAQSIRPEAEEYADALMNRLRPFMQDVRGNTALDIGGSTGAVSSALLREFEMDPLVLDPSQDELQEAASGGLRVMQGLVESLADINESFGLITLCRSVDHLTDIASSLKTIRSKIRNDGLFFVDIVNLYSACVQKEHNLTEVVKIDHPYYLTAPTMRAYLGRAGFHILAEDAYGSLHTGFFCRPAEPDGGLLPSAGSVKELTDFLGRMQYTPYACA